MLASDLDGTLIPVGLDEAHKDEIRRFGEAVRARGLQLAYVTGRGHALALRGIERFGLPLPDILVCDVGTSVWHRLSEPLGWAPDEAYVARMRDALGGAGRDDIVGHIGDLPGLELQESGKQSDFKVSYYADPLRAERLRAEVAERLAAFPVPPNAVWSHDPYSGRALLDLLPRHVAKHVAVHHLREQAGHSLDEVVYAGDSGNDFDAFLSGHPAIVVANAPDALKREVGERAAETGLIERVYFARAPFAGGVLEGLRHFGAL
jgi:HAD superfamily hydrolase (TIGR01484 family)